MDTRIEELILDRLDRLEHKVDQLMEYRGWAHGFLAALLAVAGVIGAAAGAAASWFASK